MSSQNAVVLSQVVMSVRDSFNAASTDTSINFEAEAGFAIQALSTDYAMGIALKNRQSVIDAVHNVSAIGISLNPAKKQAYLVPRDGKICLDISYMGLIDLAVATGSIKWAHAAVVYSNDNFVLRGFDEAPLHEFSPFGDRGAIQGVYVVVKTADAEYLTHTMPISEVYAIRDRSSQSYKGGKSSPWKSDEAEMIKKTCVKQAHKYWPKAERLQKAIHFLNTEGGEGLNILANQPQMPSRKPSPQLNNSISNIEHREKLILALEDAAKNGVESFRATWTAMPESDKAIVGMPERNRINEMAKDVKPAVDV